MTPEPSYEDPDHVPHDIVFRSAVAACLLAIAGLVMLVTVGWLGGVIVAVLAIPIMIVSLSRKANREREQDSVRQ